MQPRDLQIWFTQRHQLQNDPKQKQQISLDFCELYITLRLVHVIYLNQGQHGIERSVGVEQEEPVVVLLGELILHDWGDEDAVEDLDRAGYVLLFEFSAVHSLFFIIQLLTLLKLPLWFFLFLFIVYIVIIVCALSAILMNDSISNNILLQLINIPIMSLNIINPWITANNKFLFRYIINIIIILHLNQALNFIGLLSFDYIEFFPVNIFFCLVLHIFCWCFFLRIRNMSFLWAFFFILLDFSVVFLYY